MPHMKFTMRSCLVLLSISLMFLSCIKRKEQPKVEKAKEMREVVFKDPNLIENLNISYLKVTETNTDTLELQILESFGDVPPDMWVNDDTLQISKKTLDELQNGAYKHEQVTKDAEKIDLKDLKLIVEYSTKYAGKAREKTLTQYYLFTKFPAEITLPEGLEKKDSLELDLFESIGEIYRIQLGPKKLSITQKENVFVVNDKELALKAQVNLGSQKKKISIKKKLIAPVPKGPVKEEDIKLRTVDFGEGEFSTETLVEYVGVITKARHF